MLEVRATLSSDLVALNSSLLLFYYHLLLIQSIVLRLIGRFLPQVLLTHGRLLLSMLIIVLRCRSPT